MGYWNLFTDEQLKTIADNLMSSKKVLENMGIEFILYIAPNKETIYKKEIPDYYELKSKTTCTDQLIKYLKENTDIRIVYPKGGVRRPCNLRGDHLLPHHRELGRRGRAHGGQGWLDEYLYLSRILLPGDGRPYHQFPPA